MEKVVSGALGLQRRLYRTDHCRGLAAWARVADHPDEAALFQRAMITISEVSNEAIAEAYDFGAFSRVVDVGGGHGQLLSAILRRHGHLSGVLFDLPSSVQMIRSEAGGNLARTELVAGNFSNLSRRALMSMC